MVELLELSANIIAVGYHCIMQHNLRAYIRENSERVDKFISRGEIAGLLICLIGVFMMTQRIDASSYFMVAGISLLAFVYAFHGNFLADIFQIQQRGHVVLLLRAGYMALAVTAMGILFRLQHWAGGSAMLLAGCSASGIFFLFCIFKLYFGNIEDNQLRILINNLIVRMLPALLITGFLVSIAIKG